MGKSYVERDLEMVSRELAGKDVFAVISEIAERSKHSLVLSEKDQTILGAVLGSMLHQAYCDGRRLEEPLPNGLKNNPRPKVLTDHIDQDFILKVLNGELKQDPTLFVNEEGKVVMDIANRDFVNLSPHWQKDNFMAGCAAARTVITVLERKELLENPQIREFAEMLIGNSIHEAWLARENIYYDEASNGEVYTNNNLNVSFINLPKDERDKDLQHYKMAKMVIEKLYELMQEKAKQSGYGKGESGEGLQQ